MPRPLWLVIDCNYLCHRAYHAIGDLEYNDVPTGVVYGFLRDFIDLCEKFATTRVVFCFDHGPGIREQHLPTYKASRKTKYENEDDVDKKRRKKMREQVQRLRDVYLPKMGYKNVFHAKGYEGDDMIAMAVTNAIPDDHLKLIVSTDKDLYQLLDKRVRIYNPAGKPPYVYTLNKFEAEWGIKPGLWPDVKAIAGCSSDDIGGIAGVGEKTAAKFLRQELGEHTKAYEKITAGGDLWQFNLPLTKLPYQNCPTFPVQDDVIDASRWNKGMKLLGITRLDFPGNHTTEGFGHAYETN